MIAYPPKAMAAVCIMMEAEMKNRKMVGHLRMRHDAAHRIGMSRMPSKSTIWRAYAMLPSRTCARSTRGSSAMS